MRLVAIAALSIAVSICSSLPSSAQSDGIGGIMRGVMQETMRTMRDPTLKQPPARRRAVERNARPHPHLSGLGEWLFVLELQQRLKDGLCYLGPITGVSADLREPLEALRFNHPDLATIEFHELTAVKADALLRWLDGLDQPICRPGIGPAPAPAPSEAQAGEGGVSFGRSKLAGDRPPREPRRAERAERGTGNAGGSARIMVPSF